MAMNYTPDHIRDLIQFGEHTEFEVMESGRALPKDVWPTYSSFANTRGGTIILGIKEDKSKPREERFEIVGVPDPQKILTELWSNLSNPQKVSRNLLTESNVQLLPIDGMNVICIDVPEADYRQNPIYLHGDMVKHSYKRTYEGDTHLTEDDLKNMLRDADDEGR